MPAALALSDPSTDLLEAYLSAMRGLDRKTGRSTTQAARSFCAKLERSGSWEQLSLAQQSDAITKARSFVSWLLVTGRLTIAAELMTDVDLRLGVVARAHPPETYAWFVAAGEQLRLPPDGIPFHQGPPSLRAVNTPSIPAGRATRSGGPLLHRISRVLGLDSQ